DRLEPEGILGELHHHVRLAGIYRHFLLLVADRADQQSNVALRDGDSEGAIGRRLATPWPPTSVFVASPTGTSPNKRVTRPVTSRPCAGAGTGARPSARTASANIACLLMRCLRL